MVESLPLESLRPRFEDAFRAGPVVVSAPAGSGKSTLVPAWCQPPVLVVEPRRVACRTLAGRVAELRGCRLGDAVGYRVRDEHRAADDAELLRALDCGLEISRALRSDSQRDAG